MGHPARLTFPMKSLEQFRARLGVSKARQEELLDILGVRSETSTQSAKRSANKTSAKRASSGRQKVSRAKTAR